MEQGNFVQLYSIEGEKTNILRLSKEIGLTDEHLSASVWSSNDLNLIECNKTFLNWFSPESGVRLSERLNASDYSFFTSLRDVLFDPQERIPAIVFNRPLTFSMSNNGTNQEPFIVSIKLFPATDQPVETSFSSSSSFNVLMLACKKLNSECSMKSFSSLYPYSSASLPLSNLHEHNNNISSGSLQYCSISSSFEISPPDSPNECIVTPSSSNTNLVSSIASFNNIFNSRGNFKIPMKNNLLAPKSYPQMVISNPNDDTCNPFILYQYPVTRSSSFNQPSNPSQDISSSDSSRSISKSKSAKCNTFHVRTPAYYNDPSGCSRPKPRKKRKRNDEDDTMRFHRQFHLQPSASTQ